MSRRRTQYNCSPRAPPLRRRRTCRPARAADRHAPMRCQLDLAPRFELSPYLYMQFMEPLGVTDSSVEAAWDHLDDDWRHDVIEATRDLEPTMVRWGGIFTDFYRWREGVGPRDKRPTMINLMWGGLESNQVGTAEFVDFCRQVNADPLMCVNFEGDGREQYQVRQRQPSLGRRPGSRRLGRVLQRSRTTPNAAATASPTRCTVPYWQLGNETSYDDAASIATTAIDKTIEFAKAMRAADPVDQDHRLGRLRLGGRHDRARRRAPRHARVPPHVQPGRSRESGARGRALSPRRRRDVGSAHGRLEASTTPRFARPATASTAARFRWR